MSQPKITCQKKLDDAKQSYINKHKNMTPNLKTVLKKTRPYTQKGYKSSKPITIETILIFAHLLEDEMIKDLILDKFKKRISLDTKL